MPVALFGNPTSQTNVIHSCHIPAINTVVALDDVTVAIYQVTHQWLPSSSSLSPRIFKW